MQINNMDFMGYSMLNNNLFKITALALAVSVSACGGGGGYYGGSDNNSGSDSSGGDTVTAVNVSTISLYDTNGDATTTISSQGVTAQVTVTDESGNAVSGALVTFTSTGDVTFGTSNGAVLTNANGVATISVTPTDSTDTGTYQLTATTTYEDVTDTASMYVSFQAENITITNMKAASSNLGSGDSTLITLVTQDADTNSYQNNIVVNFTTSCGSLSSTSVTSSSEGNVATTYSAIDADGNLCEGTQTVTATTASGSATPVKLTLTIAAAEANSIVYTSSDTVELGIKGSGSSTSGQVEFTVYSNGSPLANKNVVLDLEKAPNDFSFVTQGNRSSTTVVSDSTGKVKVNLYPGYVPGPVEIKAALSTDTSIYALSKNVSVASGRATQSGFSISMTKNALQNAKDGDTATITARLVDRTGNPIPDDTVVNFVTEGGSITPYCTTTDGACSVTLSTQDPRPTDNRVTVLAYVEGDKSYTDTNGDNAYTAGTDTLISNLGSFFRDDNESTAYDSGEFKYTRVITGTSATCASSTIAQPNISGTCDNNLATVLRSQFLVAFAEDTPVIYNPSVSGNQFSFQLFGNGSLSVPMPSATTVGVSTVDDTENDLSCTAELRQGQETVPALFNLLTPSTFVNSTATYYAYRLKDCAKNDSVVLTITTPSGNVYKKEYFHP